MKNVPTNLSNLKSKVDKLAVGKLLIVPVDWIKNIEDKILNITNLNTNASLNAKRNEAKGEIPNITNLATTTTTLTAVENKIPNGSNLVNETDYNTNISEIENRITTNYDHDKYIITQEFIS